MGMRSDLIFELPKEGVDLALLEASLIRQALERASGNQSAAARLLGISRFALRIRAEKHGIPFRTKEDDA